MRLYPRAIRLRWGGALEREVALAGPRSWPDPILGAATTVVRDLAGKDRGTLGAIKPTMFTPALIALRTPAP